MQKLFEKKKRKKKREKIVLEKMDKCPRERKINKIAMFSGKGFQIPKKRDMFSRSKVELGSHHDFTLATIYTIHSHIHHIHHSTYIPHTCTS
jgi:hypothetical protein